MTDTSKCEEDKKKKDVNHLKEEQEGNATVARAAARGTVATLLLRLVSFACTQWTLRVLDPETLGRANIQLELLLTTVLFLSREGFRLALTRGDFTPQHWNVAWLSVPLSIAVSLIALFWHLHGKLSLEDADYRLAGILYCLACSIEGCAEPAILWELRRMNVAAKASAEGLATVVKTVTTMVALQYLQEDWPVTAFGMAQLMYALTYAVFLFSSARWSDIRPKAQTSSSSSSLISYQSIVSTFDTKTIYLAAVFTGQGFVKHLLTEADRILLTSLSDSYDQGVYAMGSSYGSIAARMLLQPIEENSRLLWTRLSTQQQQQKDPKKASKTIEDLQESYTVLVKLVLYVGFSFSCLAVNYTSVLLNLLAGKKWGRNHEATTVLSAFCVYTAFLAWNGVTEAFVYAVASSGAEMGQLSVAHSVIGFLFCVVASFTVAQYGTVGLVAANCIAMFFRAVYSLIFAARYFSSSNNNQQSSTTTKTLSSTLLILLDAMFPHRVVMAAFIGAFMLTKWSLERMKTQVDNYSLVPGSVEWLKLAAQHIAVGATCGIGILSLAYVVEGRFRRSIKSLWLGKQE